MNRYKRLVFLTAEFMCDFACLNEETGLYDLSPLIPAQEEFPPENVLNPTFELCYWRFGLNIAVIWAKEIGGDFNDWENVRSKLAMPTVSGGVYSAHQNCPDTFSRHNRDHPLMLFGCVFIPCDCIDKNIMSDTADKVLKE